MSDGAASYAAPGSAAGGRGRHRSGRGRIRRLALAAALFLAVAGPAAGILGVRTVHDMAAGTGAGHRGRAAPLATSRRSASRRASRSDQRTTAPATPSAQQNLSAAPPSSPPPPSPTHRASAPPPAPAPRVTTASPPEHTKSSSYAHQVADAVNDERAKVGCPALRYDDRIATAAYKHSKDMAQRDYFDHNTPEGATPWDRMKAEGYDQPSAENIAAGQPTPQAVVNAWMKSQGHRANILNCDSKATGVGYYRGGSYGYYWTEDFGYS